MSIPVLTFFNNKGGVGKTSLAYHLAWMLPDIGRNTLVCDLDPQANLTAAFLDEDRLDHLWNGEQDPSRGATIFECVKPFDQGRRYPAAGAARGLAGGSACCRAIWRCPVSRRCFPSNGPMRSASENLFRPFRILTALLVRDADGREGMRRGYRPGRCRPQSRRHQPFRADRRRQGHRAAWRGPLFPSGASQPRPGAPPLAFGLGKRGWTTGRNRRSLCLKAKWRLWDILCNNMESG